MEFSVGLKKQEKQNKMAENKRYWDKKYKRYFTPGYSYGKSGKKISVRSHFKHYKIKQEEAIKHRKKKTKKNWWWWVPARSRVLWGGLIIGMLYLFAALIRATFFDNNSWN